MSGARTARRAQSQLPFLIGALRRSVLLEGACLARNDHRPGRAANLWWVLLMPAMILSPRGKGTLDLKIDTRAVVAIAGDDDHAPRGEQRARPAEHMQASAQHPATGATADERRGKTVAPRAGRHRSISRSVGPFSRRSRHRARNMQQEWSPLPPLLSPPDCSDLVRMQNVWI